MMRIQDLPPPSPFMFWTLTPFLVAMMVMIPVAARPAIWTGWIVLALLWLLCLLAVIGLWNPNRYWWCWRAIGAILCLGYAAYLISMVVSGPWVGYGRRSSTTVLNALLGFITFGYPGFMYAVLGRFTIARPPDRELAHDSGELPYHLTCPDCRLPLAQDGYTDAKKSSRIMPLENGPSCNCERTIKGN